MLRWLEVDDKVLFGMTVKMYRNPFVATKTSKSLFTRIELDHQAFKYFDGEVFLYRILDTNFDRYMEERGDLDRIEDILIPIQIDESATIL